ncbi:alkylhydroperoxidase [Acetobacter nitrogenifigens DSM 23921 = NBRC 105050]|uniref:Alkyl hydroperoxide reductase AhpD n=2 Tax=Acetobacter TaxID=434 RepID=A0A511X7L7_9PROT|nr:MULTISPECIES: carboxymuconolactone decarboxylase family protein [Acetobacter]MBO1358196.1 carboxymuconolactone decarboxylase family protein [Acetobacter sacchari]OUJ13548.1 alkylhydroperoxidase [Acetobacter sp. DsW_063]GBQ95797.1 alkylhydroperoxidase [Acetobacter nitrogenifigens DSM 23921 = NBRC 105050]GEN58944.1 alkyl hydroperoxide reductase AhpD [Acetobacter nitrogenifigens DSM 23921 = NBRC 105050]
MSDWADWGARREHLGKAIGGYAQLSPATVESVLALNAAGEKTNHLDAKTRELIALAVAATTRCDGCITIHAAEAVKAGATRDEIGEALSVAIALNAGAALVYSTRVLDAFDAVKKGE